MLAAWGFKFVNSREEFKAMDAKRQGYLLFDDFADYCIKKSISSMKNNLKDSMKILSQQTSHNTQVFNKTKMALKKHQKASKNQTANNTQLNTTLQTLRSDGE